MGQPRWRAEGSSILRDVTGGRMSESPRRILIVEDQRLIAADLERTVRALGYEVVGSAVSGEEAIQRSANSHPELVLMDIRLHGNIDGIRAATIIRERFDVPVVYLTAYTDEDTILRAKVTTPFGYVVKPFQDRELKAAIEIALYRQDAERMLAAERWRRQCAEEAQRQKDNFIAMLGHELRNPLAAIRSATELLKLRSDGQEQQVRAHAVLERQSAHMAKLIDGLLDFSRMAGGRIVIERVAVDVNVILRDLVQDRRAQIDRCGLTFVVETPATPLWVCGDQVRLAQVFDNLLSNAMRFTESGGRVTLRAAKSGDEVLVRVQDTGVGIEPKLLPHIFEPFRQGKQTLARAGGGLGLGLALVKGLIELHGGTVRVVSGGRGAGSEFIVGLPSGPAPVEKMTEPPARASGSRILIVEDNADAAETLQTLLQASGHDVRVAYEGETALRMAAGFLPDLVLCDIGLPGALSGYEVAGSLRESSREALLVAVSGYGGADDVRRSHEAGFDQHLTKPVDFLVIERLLVERQRIR